MNSLPQACPLCLKKNAAKFLGYKTNKFQGLFPERKYTEAERVVVCKSCGLYYNDPPAKQLKPVFEEDDSLMDLTHINPESLKSEEGYKEFLDFLRNRIELAKNATVLDMGSGTGRSAYAFKQEGYTVYAVEPKKELFEFSVKHKLIDKERSQNKSFEETHFEEASFDFIFLEPLNHLNNPHEAIQKALKWLKPQGYLHLEVVNANWLYKKILYGWYKLNLRKHVPFTSALRKPFNACEFSPKSFKVYARQNNLKLCALESYACNTSIPNKFLSSLMIAYMGRFKQGMELSIILQKK